VALFRPMLQGRSVIALMAIGLLLLSLAMPAVASADDGPVMNARALLQGHVRTGSWFAVAVDVENAGPTVNGELRINGGVDSRTRFGTPVELATGSRKQYVLYAQPPTFGGKMKVQLVSGDKVVSEATVAVAPHDQSQLVVGVVSENPAKIVGELKLLPGSNGTSPTIVPLTPADLPERLQAWSGLDRIVWQDVDASALTPAQLDALRGWIAGGGRLVIVGGTAGADALAAFPDDLLPYRPTSVLDIDPTVLRPILGGVPAGAATLTAYAGDQGLGRPLAQSGDRVVAADLKVGNGSVTLLGFDPTTSWLATGETWDTPLWRRLLPARSGAAMSLSDDSQIVSAVTNLPSLALPPLGGLLVLLLGYIILVGPVNYLVLRRLDRREWAWVTVPALIAVFTAGSFGIGALMRGSDIVVHEVAIVRGAPATDEATAQSYLGIFSPSRDTFQLKVPGDALLASPINGDIFGTGVVNTLDILQGDPSRVRDLAIGVGSLRTIRAESSTKGPKVEADLHVVDGTLTGTITNKGTAPLSAVALVVGSASKTIGDIAPGATAKVSFPVGSNPFNQNSLSDRVLGVMNWDGQGLDAEGQRMLVRRSILDQISVDPMTGISNGLPAETATLLAWGTDEVIPLEIEGQKVRHLSNVLYEVALPYSISGTTTFRYDMLRTTVTDMESGFFTKDPWTMTLGPGAARVAYRPIPFEGTFAPAAVTVGMTFGGDLSMPAGKPATLRETKRCDPAAEGCFAPQDGLPDIEVLDIGTGAWVQFEHLAQGRPYELPDARRWVDPTTGEVQVRFVNEGQQQVGFQLPMEIKGTIR
jgi:hypothetical protein